MGSKRWMLKNGLGTLLSAESLKSQRFIDLFSGSGAVATFVASKRSIPCLSYDLQSFCVVLSGAIISRDSVIDSASIWGPWLERAEARIGKPRFPVAGRTFTKKYVQECREWCGRRKEKVTKAYGGHYFSPSQSLWIDGLRATLPGGLKERQVALSALIQAASHCAASPGHTAQPFQPTPSAKSFIKDAWSRSLKERTKSVLETICKQHALCSGRAEVMDANLAVNDLKVGDLVFIDPPYSGVHYSRFYHVLETIARGSCSKVSGIGRYPSPEERPTSKYSVSTQSSDALDTLLAKIAERGAKVILTFPSHKCSNGLSGSKVEAIGRKYFKVTKELVKGKFSTLGGNAKTSKTGNKRDARQHSKELILLMKPKRNNVATKTQKF